ncbi:hypothetical protein [Rhizorhabdus dicambivorans]|uniref:hypothetical protein n=1 Tax=Rhizorhabdus dicambivorans TaxID=1850238 RepID=UPI001111E45C|nr:hypothetical protein [Rhizorhabdus dicambivorans]
MELKFAATTKPAPLTAETKRRRKLIQRIDQQLGHVRQMIEGKQPRGAWAWMDEAGTYFVPIKYGRHQIELKKGMFSVQCKDLDEVEHAFCTIRAMVMDGQFDERLTKLSVDIRQRFKKAH